MKQRTARISLCGEVSDTRRADAIVARNLYKNNIESRTLALPVIHGNIDLRIENPDEHGLVIVGLNLLQFTGFCFSK